MKLSVFVFCLLHLSLSAPVLPNSEHHQHLGPPNTGNNPQTQLPPLREVLQQIPHSGAAYHYGNHPGPASGIGLTPILPYNPNASRSHHQLPSLHGISHIGTPPHGHLPQQAHPQHLQQLSHPQQPLSSQLTHQSPTNNSRPQAQHPHNPPHTSSRSHRDGFYVCPEARTAHARLIHATFVRDSNNSIFMLLSDHLQGTHSLEIKCFLCPSDTEPVGRSYFGKHLERVHNFAEDPERA